MIVIYEFLEQYKYDYLKIINKIRGLGTASPGCRQAHCTSSPYLRKVIVSKLIFLLILFLINCSVTYITKRPSENVIKNNNNASWYYQSYKGEDRRDDVIRIIGNDIVEYLERSEDSKDAKGIKIQINNMHHVILESALKSIIYKVRYVDQILYKTGRSNSTFRILGFTRDNYLKLSLPESPNDKYFFSIIRIFDDSNGEFTHYYEMVLFKKEKAELKYWTQSIFTEISNDKKVPYYPTSQEFSDNIDSDDAKIFYAEILDGIKKDVKENKLQFEIFKPVLLENWN